MENKTFLVKTFGSTVEGTYVIVAGSKEEAEETYLAYRKEHVEIPLHEGAILHLDNGDR